MEYTKFHIGLYITLFGAALAYVKSKDFTHTPTEISFVKWAMVCFVVAGLAGGIIAGNIPYHKTFDDFKVKWIGPYKWELMPFEVCAGIEHTVFWVGVLLIVLGFLVSA